MNGFYHPEGEEVVAEGDITQELQKLEGAAKKPATNLEKAGLTRRKRLNIWPVSKNLYQTYLAAIKKHGVKHAQTLKHQKALIDYFSHCKLSVKQFNRQTNRLRKLLEKVRIQERIIMKYVRGQSRHASQEFHSFISRQ